MPARGVPVKAQQLPCWGSKRTATPSCANTDTAAFPPQNKVTDDCRTEGFHKGANRVTRLWGTERQPLTLLRWRSRFGTNVGWCEGPDASGWKSVALQPARPPLRKKKIKPTGVNLWGNTSPRNGACNHFFAGRLGEVGAEVHFCYVTGSELARRLARATSITQPAAPSLAWRGHQEQIETAVSTRVLNGSEDDCLVDSSCQESICFLFMVRNKTRWGGGVRQATVWNVKNIHHFTVLF